MLHIFVTALLCAGAAIGLTTLAEPPADANTKMMNDMGPTNPRVSEPERQRVAPTEEAPANKDPNSDRRTDK
jgi:hypothetical protein